MYRCPIIIFLIACALFSCRRVDTHSHGPEGVDHSHDGEAGHTHEEEGTLSYTIWTEGLELFVEFPPLVVGRVSRFAAHYTHLDGYEPVREGSLMVSLIQGTRGLRHTVENPASPGIFNPALQPKTAGAGQLIFDLELDGRTHRIEIDSVEVFPDQVTAQASLPEEVAGVSDISFLKEQAWRMDFAVAPAKRRGIREPIRTAGVFLSAAGGEEKLVAPSSGIVTFQRPDLAPGQYVQSGEWLFTLGFTGDPEEDLSTRMEKAKATLDQARRAYERQKMLTGEQASSRKELEEAQLDLDLAQAEYDNLLRYRTEGGRKVTARTGGFVKMLHLQPGDYVSTGAPLLTLAQQRRLRLQADLPQAQLTVMDQVQSASFRMPGEKDFHPMAAFNGRRLPSGLTVDATEPYVPLYFELDNRGKLLPGAFVEVLLFAGPPAERLAVPRPALLEEYGNYSVIVQRGGETFEKRPVEIGIDDGAYVEVRSGLSAGEIVVTKGAYQVKMASMSTAVPGHGHTH